VNGSEEGNIITINPSGEEGLSALPAVIQPEVVEPVPGKKKPDRVEKEIHRKALAFYFALGPTRTLARVAQEFKLKEATILNWSATFGWKERVLDLENRSKESEFREKAMDLLLLTMDSLVKKNKKTGALTLANTEKATVEKLKMSIDSFKRLRDDSREDRDSAGEGAGDRSGKGRRMQGVVETNIRKDGLTITVWPQK
jgi:hypothetical protein